VTKEGSPSTRFSSCQNEQTERSILGSTVFRTFDSITDESSAHGPDCRVASRHPDIVRYAG